MAPRAHIVSEQISPSRPPILDGTGRVAVDLKCLNCGYNLRTQPVTGRCPECGHPVSESTRDPRLSRADPKWVVQLSLALLVIILCSTASVIWLVLVAIQDMGGYHSFDETCVFWPVLLSGVAVMIALMAFTQRDPRRQRYPRPPLARSATRVTLLLLIALVLAAFLFRHSFTIVSLTAMLVFAVGFLVLPLVFLGHVADLMRRIPRDDVARRARVCGWGFVGGVLTYIGGALLCEALPRSSEWIGIATMAVGGAGLLFFGVFTLIVLIQAQRALAHAARLSGKREA
jgi:uncharacterized membrane protein YhdT